MSDVELPIRQIRAAQTDTSLTVYQAYSPAIALPALEAGRFVPPFRRNRMTWIKPSFLWMAYRCGWATKEGQEHVLAIEISKEGFESALANSTLSHYEPGLYDSHDDWREQKNRTPVRIQWDPERDLHLQPLQHRAIQVGLSGQASQDYVDKWTIRIREVTGLMKDIRQMVKSDRLDRASAMLPTESPYPLPDDLATALGASRQ